MTTKTDSRPMRGRGPLVRRLQTFKWYIALLNGLRATAHRSYRARRLVLARRILAIVGCLGGEDADLLDFRGHLAEETEDITRAEKFYEATLAIDPGLARARLRLLRLLLRESRLGDALVHAGQLRLLGKLEPWDARYIAALAIEARGDYELALDYYKVAADAGDLEGRYSAGHCLLDLERPAEAMEYFESIVSSADPVDALRGGLGMASATYDLTASSSHAIAIAREAINAAAVKGVPSQNLEAAEDLVAWFMEQSTSQS